MANWCLIENQPLLKTIFKRPPIISYEHACKNKNVPRRHLIMRRNHKNSVGSPCRSVFDFLSTLTRKRACEQLQKFGEHEQASTRLNFASKSNKGKVLRAVHPYIDSHRSENNFFKRSNFSSLNSECHFGSEV